MLIVVAVLGVFYPALHNGFVSYDDPDYIVKNPRVYTGLSYDNTVWAFTAFHANNWHPLTWLSHGLDATLFRNDPRGHHLTSVVLHALNAVLLFYWLHGATGQMIRSALVAFGFGLHPLHVESVAWISERKDVLSTLFWMLALIAYTSWVRKRGAALYALVAALLTLGLLAKQMLVTAPLLFLVIDRWPLQREDRWRRLIIEKLPLLALSAVFSAMVLWVQGTTGAIGQLPLDERLANAAASYIRYLGKAAWPINLTVFYPMTPVAVWKWAGSLALILALSALAHSLRIKRPWLAAGWAWFLLTPVPVIGIVQVGMQSMADRYMYVPLVGLLIALAWQARPLLLVSIAVWAVLSWQQIAVWRDGLTLFTHAVRVSPDNFIAHVNLGVELDRRGEFESALHHYRETLRIRPGDRQGETNYAHANFAKAERLIAAGKPDEALKALHEGLRYRPRHALAQTLVGRILTQQKKIEEALAAFNTALESDPTFAAAHMGKGVIYAWTGKPFESRAAFAEAVRHDPRNAEARYNLGLVLTVAGTAAEARAQFEAALAIDPNFAAARTALSDLR